MTPCATLCATPACDVVDVGLVEAAQCKRENTWGSVHRKLTLGSRPSSLCSLGRPGRSRPHGYLRMYCAHLCIVSNICGNMAVMEVVIRSRKYWIASSSVLFS